MFGAFIKTDPIDAKVMDTKMLLAIALSAGAMFTAMVIDGRQQRLPVAKRKRPHLLDRVVGLVLDRALRPLADDKVRLHVAGLLQGFQKAHAENGAGRAGHADDEASHWQSFQLGRAALWALGTTIRRTGYHFGHFPNKCPNLRIAKALSSGDGALTSGNWSFQWNGRQASINTRSVV